MKPTGMREADFRSRRKQLLTGSVKNLEAVGQTAMPVFLAVRYLINVSAYGGPQMQNYNLTLAGISANAESTIVLLRASKLAGNKK